MQVSPVTIMAELTPTEESSPDPRLRDNFYQRCLLEAQSRKYLMKDGWGRPIVVPARPITGEQAALYFSLGCVFERAVPI